MCAQVREETVRANVRRSTFIPPPQKSRSQTTRCPGRACAMPTAQRAGGLRARMGDEGKAVGFPRLTALLSEFVR